MKQPVLMSMVRNDGMRCCYKCPCKWLNTFVCCECCQDGLKVYAGPLQDEVGKEKGRPYQLNNEMLIGTVTQPIYGGCYRPVLHVGGHDHNATPFAKIEGPCIFGGWSEMCCDFRFYTSSFGGASKSGDIALITKKKPQSMAGALQELGSEADVYTIEFKSVAQPEQKVTVLAAQLLADYMWFDGNTEKCAFKDEGIYCYCFYCSIVGALFPCYLFIPKK